MALPDLIVRPIGVVHSPFRERMEAPRQPAAAKGVQATIELLPGHHFEDAISDLEGWQYIWVVFWFHANEGWRPKVLPPRSSRRRGVFATRSPHRPNPIGLSVVELVRVDGLTLHVTDVDLLDGTPVLDLKPYVPWADAIPGARTGWLDEEHVVAQEGGGAEAGRPADPLGRWEVDVTDRVALQLALLREHGVDLEGHLRSALSVGPQPHAYRRIRIDADGTRRLALKEWRLRFRVEGRRIEVFDILSGYRTRELEGEAPSLAVHRALVAAFPPLP